MGFFDNPRSSLRCDFWANIVDPDPSDVPALAWPESPSFGLALGSSGFVKSQAKPKAVVFEG